MINTSICAGKTCQHTTASGNEGQIIANYVGAGLFLIAVVIAIKIATA